MDFNIPLFAPYSYQVREKANKSPINGDVIPFKIKHILKSFLASPIMLGKTVEPML